MQFSSKLLRNTLLPEFALNDAHIRVVESFKYLGNFLKSDLTDDLDIARQRRQLYAQGNMLLRRFHMCSLEVKIKLFQSHCAPITPCRLGLPTEHITTL